MVQIGRHYIQGRWIAGTVDPFESINPATGQVVWEGHNASSQDVVYAIKSAREAQKKWEKLSVDQRISYLKRFEARLTFYQSEFSEIISKETGKPLWESKMEVGAMIQKISISIESYGERCSDKIITQHEKKVKTSYRAHGVVVVLGPFNFPGHLPNGHIIPSLLFGNTIVFKPSEMTPYSGQFLIKIWDEAGLPAGVINLVQGNGQVGELLFTHPDINGLFFTGSSKVGHQLSAFFGKHPDKIVALEMGGNNPLVVSKISNIEASIYTTIQSAYITSGQRCSCARRLIVVKNEKNNLFIEQLCGVMKDIKVGAYTDKQEPFMGPVISLKSAHHLLLNQEWLMNMGAKSLVKMTQIKENKPFLTPGLLDVSKISKTQDEEWFGPLLQLQWVSSLEEAIEEANRTRFGLSASLISSSKDEYNLFSQEIRAGIINWNSPTTGASSRAPFGGIGSSGNHRASAYFATDYCSYPVASITSKRLVLPETISPGVSLASISKEKNAS